MKWVPKPTDCYSDVDLEEAGERAELLWHRAWAWCGLQETGGFIPASMMARLCPSHTKARVAALVRVGKLAEVEGGYQLTDWDEALGELRSLQHRKKSDASRARRYRANKKVTAPSRDESADASRPASRPASRDDHALEEKRDNPPTPRQAGGTNCDPISKPHSNCRGCRSTPRLIAADLASANAAAAAAALDDQVRRRAELEWCGDYECNRSTRQRITATGGSGPCSECHPDVVVGPLPRQLTVVGAR